MAGKGGNNAGSLIIRSRIEAATQETQKRIFLNILEKVHAVRVAAKLADIHHGTLYRWRKEDAQFAEDWDHAIAYSSEALESGAYLKLAKELTSEKALSMPAARLTEFFLAGMMPDKYKQRGINNEVNITNQQLNISIDWASVPDDMLAKYNEKELTLQDIYDWQIQSKERQGSDTSADRCAE